uniref:Uncharacterized protein n=1 Tax=Anguilla anguilla TaxID=7936 RepID=A0A0E9WLL3_ANGAN
MSVKRNFFFIDSLCGGLLPPVNEGQHSNIVSLLEDPSHDALQQELHSFQMDAQLQQRERLDTDG